MGLSQPIVVDPANGVRRLSWMGPHRHQMTAIASGFRDGHQSSAGRVFLVVAHVLLVVATGMTLFAAGQEVWSVYERRIVDLADILLMFLYTEVIGMSARASA